MKLYEVNDGATYWVAARNAREAIDLMWQHYEEMGMLEEVEDSYFHVDPMSLERAEKLRIYHDDGQLWDGQRGEYDTLISCFKSAEEACILGCSEWP